MKNIKWLLNLASRKPLIFSLALLLIAVATLATVVANRDIKLDNCNKDKKQIQEYYNVKFDSLSSYYRSRELTLNNELRRVLNSIIADYKDQLEEQKKLSETVNTTINKNRNLIKTNKNKIQNLQR